MTTFQIKERVELPERGWAKRVMDWVVYGEEGDKFGGSSPVSSNENSNDF